MDMPGIASFGSPLISSLPLDKLVETSTKKPSRPSVFELRQATSGKDAIIQSMKKSKLCLKKCCGDGMIGNGESVKVITHFHLSERSNIVCILELKLILPERILYQKNKHYS